LLKGKPSAGDLGSQPNFEYADWLKPDDDNPQPRNATTRTSIDTGLERREDQGIDHDAGDPRPRTIGAATRSRGASA
jgi:hypothetical protein